MATVVRTVYDPLPVDPREFRLIRAGDLEIDPREQRPLNDGAVQRLTEEFDWLVFETLSVRVTASGKYKVYEGQHRARAVQFVAPDTLVPCMVAKDKDFNASKAALKMAEGRRNHSAFEKWRLRLAGGDERETLATQVMHERQVDVGTTKNYDTINAVVMIVRIMDSGETFKQGAIMLGKIIDVIREAWPDWQDDAVARWESAFIEAVWTTIRDYGEIISHQTLVGILKERPIRFWLNVGKPDVRQGNESAAEAIARQIMVDFDAAEKKRKKRPAKRA